MFLRVMASGNTRARKDADVIDLAGDSEDDERKGGTSSNENTFPGLIFIRDHYWPHWQ